MNKAELVDAIAADTGVSKAKAQQLLNSFTESVGKTLKKGDKLTLVGFGTFATSKRAARKGVNPQTGKQISIAAKKVVKFKPGKELSTKVK